MRAAELPHIEDFTWPGSFLHAIVLTASRRGASVTPLSRSDPVITELLQSGDDYKFDYARLNRRSS